MLETFALAAHFTTLPEPDWSARKRLIRERVAEIVEAGNHLHSRNDAPPRIVMERVHGAHGKYDVTWDRLVLDLESLHDTDKFWHVYRETIPHEWAHKLNHEINRARGHGRDFEQLYHDLRATTSTDSPTRH